MELEAMNLAYSCQSTWIEESEEFMNQQTKQITKLKTESHRWIGLENELHLKNVEIQQNVTEIKELQTTLVRYNENIETNLSVIRRQSLKIESMRHSRMLFCVITIIEIDTLFLVFTTILLLRKFSTLFFSANNVFKHHWSF